MKKAQHKNAGQAGGGARGSEKGDARRPSGGPGEPSRLSRSGRSISKFGGPAKVQRFAKPVSENAPTRAPKSHRERHADKQQPEESGPGRASKPPPQRGRFERQ
jgi:hypothetical protein